MRLAFLSTMSCMAVCAGQAVLGQATTPFSQLEQRIQGAPPGTSAAAAPGTGYLGAIVDDDGERGRGVRVISAKPGAPASLSGLKDGDLIVAIDGKPVTGLGQLDAVLDRAVPNQKLQMTIDRGGARQQVTVTLGTRPAAAPGTDQNSGEPPATAPTLRAPGTPPAALPSAVSPAAPAGPAGAPSLSSPTGAETPATPPAPSSSDSVPRGPGIRATPQDAARPSETPARSDFDATPPVAGGGASLGITVVPLTDEARARSAVPVRRGALIAAIKPGSPADTAGLPVGGVIVRIDGRAIDSPDDLVAAIKAARAGQEVELSYYEGGRLSRKPVRLAAAAAAAPGGPGGIGGIGPPGSLPDDGGFVVPSAPPGGAAPRFGGGAGGSRPLLEKIEQLADNLTRPTGTTTVYDPLAMAALQTRVVELSEQLKALEERIRVLEGKQGVSPPTSGQRPAISTPGFGSPGATPGATPGFGTGPGGAGSP